jgi:hypothetical protein
MKKILLLAFLAIGFQFHAGATISQVRWGSTTDPLTGLTITWSNTGAADSIKWGYTTSFEKGAMLGTKRAGYTSGTSFFKYTFATVTASSTIYYKLYDSGTHTWGAQSTFKTAPPLNTNVFTFCALGDCRDYPATLTTVSNLASARNPTFCLFNGDLTLSGNSSSQYNTFFTAASNFLANNLAYHAEGNHDASSPSMFSNLWDLPMTNGTNLYYSTRYGNAIFITINTNTPTDAAQLTWLQNTLSAAASDPTIIWKIVSCHHAFFTTGSHAGDMNSYRTTIWKAFDDYGVDLVITGHDHNFQRTKPVNLNVSSTVPVAKYGSATGQGRCQVVTGGAGAGLYAAGSTADAWAMTTFNSTYNYTYVKIQNCTLKLYGYSSTNAIIDSLILDKSATMCLATGISAPGVKSNTLTVFPNPAASTFTLNYSSDLTGEALIRITDINGKEVASEKMNKTQQEMEFKYDMSKFPKGTYNVSVVLGDEIKNAILILAK